MVTENRVKELIAESLEMVKQFDASYKKLQINDRTILMGDKSELESIAFTVFVTQLEEKVEAETGTPYTLNLDEISKAEAKSDLSLEVMAKAISKSLATASK